MTPKISIAGVMVRNGCRKPGCTREPTYRHHKGSEHSWVRTFSFKRFSSDKKRYLEFVARYESFHEEDCIELCGDHHEEIHWVYEAEEVNFICVNKLGWLRSQWSWEQAETLMQHLRGVCDEWLKKATPGRRRRRFTTYT